MRILLSSKRRRRLKRGLFRSVVDPQAAINRFLAETNAEPKPFTWTADPDKSSPPSDKGHQALDSIHWTRGVPSIRISNKRAVSSSTFSRLHEGQATGQ
jgi:hypothetical protein